MAKRIEIKDDRIIYLAIRWRGDQGLFVEGGFNGEFDFLSKEQKKFALTLALEAVMANGIAALPDDVDFKEYFDKHTDLGKAGGPHWRATPPTPSE